MNKNHRNSHPTMSSDEITNAVPLDQATPDNERPWMNLRISRSEVSNDPQKARDLQSSIRELYKSAELQPYFFCSYAGFARVFPEPDIYEAFATENLNIIDVHLKYNQYIYEKMAPFKWVPSVVLTIATRLHPVSLVFPFLYVKFIDHYFKDFLVWRYSQDKIINIAYEFSTKLSKDKNILRRVLKFSQIRPHLAQEHAEIPYKYIKFGAPSSYIFHTRSGEEEVSGSFLSTFFENVLKVQTLGISSVASIPGEVSEFWRLFSEYKGILNKEKLPILTDFSKLVRFKQVKDSEVFNVSKQIESRVQRLLEVGNYWLSGEAGNSNFNVPQLMHLNKNYDLLSPMKYNVENNNADFSMFYGTVFAIKLLQLIVRRVIKM